jgi:8-oxo-dGTP pyrophosphatase MutT (NUDIX family)
VTFEIWPADGPGPCPVGDDRGEARRQLLGAQLVGAQQEELRRRVIDFLDLHPDCLHRTCRPGHLTGSAVVVDPARGRALLIHHAKLNRWLQPGGHADGEGNLALVARKEAVEETGLTGLRLVTPAIDLDRHAIPARPGEPAHDHLDLRFLILAGPSTLALPNDETLGARWVEPGDPVVTASGELARLVNRATMVAARLDL